MAEELLFDKEPEKEIDHGGAVRFLRETFNMSQTGLGEGLGVNQQAISRIEQSKKLPEKKIIQIAQFFNVPVELIKNFSPSEHKKNVISGNKFGQTNGVVVEYQTNNSDPKVFEVFERLIKEKDKLLAEKDRRIVDLQKQLASKK